MIDWSRVRQLQDDVGAEGFDEVIDLFIKEVEAVITRLATLGDRNELGNDLHFLKGSAMSLGFKLFSQHCHNGEIAARNGNAESIDMVELLDCYALSKKLFFADYAEMMAA